MSEAQMQASMRRLATRIAAVFTAALVFQGCGCDLVGCAGGLTATLAVLPPEPFLVELLVDGVVTSTVNCTADRHCNDQIVFGATPTKNVAVRVTTAAGTRLTEFARVTYTKQYPNGKRCDPECHTATVNVNVAI